MAKSGIAPDLGSGDRRFEPSCSDQFLKNPAAVWKADTQLA